MASKKANNVNLKSKSKMPETIAPMLATLVSDPIESPGWQYEIKWDGYRAVTTLHQGKVSIRSRNNKSFDEKFYAIHDALKRWKINAIVDGEIIVADDNGKANFGALQNWRSEADGNLMYFIFDILWLEGKDLTQLPLSERRNLLKSVMPESDIIKLSKNFETTGKEFFNLAKKLELEGIMAKKADSLYLAGKRSKDWLKIKTESRQEVVIGGYTINEGTSRGFSSLLVGVYKNKKLEYIGKIGTGFNAVMQKDLLKQFKPLIIKKSPFSNVPDVNKPSRFRPDPPAAKATWLKPTLICEVRYRELTKDGIMRHPSFVGMRSDKNANTVVLEKPADLPDTVMVKKTGAKYILSVPKKSNIKTLLNPSEKTQVKKIKGHDLKFNNLDKIFWPDAKVSKRDMINYYFQIAPYILPHLKNRPQSLNRFPNGITGKSFYQKNVKGKVPDWMDTYPYKRMGEKKEFLICNEEATLLYMAGLGSIEINPWNSTIKNPDNPDWCVIDLDPDKQSFNQVIETAIVTHDILESAGIPSYCKTSGSTGLHIYIPLGAKYKYEASREFGRLIAHLVTEALPKITSIERLIQKRNGKLYVDFLQNRPQATLASVYSLRPKPGATVSMPLQWEEVKNGLRMQDFNIFNAMERIKTNGDIFKPVLGKGINMEEAINNLKANHL